MSRGPNYDLLPRCPLSDMRRIECAHCLKHARSLNDDARPQVALYGTE